MKSHPALAWALILTFCLVAVAQEPADKPPASASPTPSALGIRQERVKHMMEDLEQKFGELARALDKTEPEQAARLAAALQESKKLSIEGRMDSVIHMLDQSSFDGATSEQKRLIADLKRLISILLEEDSELERMLKELKRLEQWRGEIKKLIREETDQKRESEKLSDKDKTLEEMARRIAQLEKLIERQKGVIAKTADARGQGVQGLEPIAEEQAALRRDTEKLADEIAKPRGGRTPQTKPRPGDEDPPDGSPATPAEPGKPGEPGAPGTPGEPGQPGQPSPGSPSPSPPTPGSPSGSPSGTPSGSPSGSPSGTPSGSPSKPSPGSPNALPAGSEAGQRPLESAAREQAAAEKNLDQKKAKSAEEHQRKALSDLERALAELKGEKSRIATLPPEAFDTMAGKQDDTKGRTGKLGDDVAKAAGEPGTSEEQQQKTAAAAARLQEAQKSMQSASGNLRQKAPKPASDKQREAIKKLEQAREEIEQRLAQLRKEMQAEKLAALEARFREMLIRQEPVTIATVNVDKARVDGKLRRTDRLAVAGFAEEERAIAELASRALEILIEDGTSIVFVHVVEQLRDDLQSAGSLLQAEKTEQYTQSVQQEIERTLKELIEALERAQENLNSMGGGEGMPGEGNEPLLPGSAELKLLKSAQLRVNRRTESFEATRPPGALDEALRKEVQAIARRQFEVAEMTAEMAERQ